MLQFLRYKVDTIPPVTDPSATFASETIEIEINDTFTIIDSPAPLISETTETEGN